VIDSIGDNEAYLAFNCTPVAHIIQILLDSFDPARPQEPFSLQLQGRPRKLFSSFRYDEALLYVAASDGL
jgi:hypothetical protein